jgi:ribosomal protein L30/L7E
LSTKKHTPRSTIAIRPDNAAALRSLGLE